MAPLPLSSFLHWQGFLRNRFTLAYLVNVSRVEPIVFVSCHPSHYYFFSRFSVKFRLKIDRKLSVKVLFMLQPLNMNVWQLNTQIVLDLAASVLFLQRFIHNWQNNLKMTAKLFFSRKLTKVIKS
jgi:hypothetical protein